MQYLTLYLHLLRKPWNKLCSTDCAVESILVCLHQTIFTLLGRLLYVIQISCSIIIQPPSIRRKFVNLLAPTIHMFSNQTTSFFCSFSKDMMPRERTTSLNMYSKAVRKMAVQRKQIPVQRVLRLFEYVHHRYARKRTHQTNKPKPLFV